jgi:hypothetical protein
MSLGLRAPRILAKWLPRKNSNRSEASITRLACNGDRTGSVHHERDRQRCIRVKSMWFLKKSSHMLGGNDYDVIGGNLK